MGKQEHAAARIQRQYGVRCEWAPANHEYVVDFRRAGSTAAQARSFAREYARRLREEVRS
jgi:hypothetical protein